MSGPIIMGPHGTYQLTLDVDWDGKKEEETTKKIPLEPPSVKHIKCETCDRSNPDLVIDGNEHCIFRCWWCGKEWVGEL